MTKNFTLALVSTVCFIGCGGGSTPGTTTNTNTNTGVCTVSGTVEAKCVAPTDTQTATDTGVDTGTSSVTKTDTKTDTATTTNTNVDTVPSWCSDPRAYTIPLSTELTGVGLGIHAEGVWSIGGWYIFITHLAPSTGISISVSGYGYRIEQAGMSEPVVPSTVSYEGVMSEHCIYVKAKALVGTDNGALSAAPTMSGTAMTTASDGTKTITGGPVTATWSPALQSVPAHNPGL